MRVGKHTQRRLIASALFGVFVMLVLAVVGDVRGIGESLGSFRWSIMPVVVALALGNYVLRFLRWAYYLRLLDIHLPLRDSVTVFMSGLAMSITPGKMGELVKSYFLKQMTDTAMSRSVPIVFAERFTDFFAIVVLAGLGAFSFRYGEEVVWTGLGFTLAVLVVAMIRPLVLRLIDLGEHLPRIGDKMAVARRLYEHAYTLLRFRPLMIAFTFGIASWFCECVGFYLTIGAFGYTMSLWKATFIYAFATFFGAVTFLPGGLGATEGSMAGLTMTQGIPKDVAAAATIVIRVATLWFAVALGLAWLAPNRQLLIPDKDDLDRAAETDGN